MNNISVIGRLTHAPQLSETPSGVAVCKFTVAVKRPFSTDDTDFFNVVVWRKKAETCNEYLIKGQMVAVEGYLQNRSYENKEGERKYVTEIVANNVEFLDKPSGEDRPSSTEKKSPKYEQQRLKPLDEDEGLPF